MTKILVAEDDALLRDVINNILTLEGYEVFTTVNGRQALDHLRPAIPYVLYHHEWWNGQGYPFGLKRRDIPAGGRLLAIVDAFDAMTSNRPYRRGVSVAVALAETQKNSGVYFDPEMVKVFLQSYKA